MLGNRRAGRLVLLSVAVYQVLVRLYPNEFRRDFGPAMVQVFRDACRHASQEGRNGALLALWMRTAVDFIQTVIDEYARGGTHMTRDKFYKLSGWAMILGPIAFFVGILATSMPYYNRSYNVAVNNIEYYINQLGLPVALMGMLLISLGFTGMLLRFSPRMDLSGILMAVSALASWVCTVGIAGIMISEDGLGGSLVVLGMIILGAAIAGFGLVNLRYRLLPRWNALPVLAILFPMVVLAMIEVIQFEFSAPVFFSAWLLVWVIFAGLGYVLQSTPRKSALATA